MPDEEINAAPAAPVIQTTDISREIFGDDTEDNDDTEIIAGGEEIAVQKKKKKKKKKKKNSEGLSLDSLASSLFDKVSTLTDKVSNLSGKKNQKEEDPAEKAANDFSFPENQEASNGGLDFSLFDNDVPSAAAEPEKTAELSPASEDTAADEDQWEYVEVPAEEILSQLQPEQTAQTEEPASEEQSSAVLADNDDWGYHTTTEEFPAENIPAEPVDLPSEEIATDWGIEADTSSAETEDISKPIQNSPLSEDTVSPEETAAEPDTAVTAEASAENTDEGWEYVAVPEEESVAESADGNTAEGDWEWEYEEVPEDDGSTAEFPQQTESAETTPTDDPYRPETALQTPAETETTSLSSMYSGEVYFQDNVYDNLETAKEEETFKIPEDIGDGPGLADLETGEAPNEPYKPQGTI